MHKTFWVFLMGCFTLIWLSNATAWKMLAKGLNYQKVTETDQEIYAFQIDPSLYQLKLEQTANNPSNSPLPDDALVGVNGGFFGESMQPLGLRISEGKALNAYKNISWWAIFLIENNTPSILDSHSYPSSQTVEFAIQSGPRLLMNGQIPSLKAGVASRSAICIDDQQKIIIAATQSPVELHEWARILRDDFQCKNALNLDGGNSTQLQAKVGNFHLNLPSINSVADRILVEKK